MFPEGPPNWIQGPPGEEAALVVKCIEDDCMGGHNLSVVDFRADTTWVLLNRVSRVWYVPTGHVVWVAPGGAVFATPFDLDRLAMSDAHELLFEGVRTYSQSTVEMVMVQDGTVVYVEWPPQQGKNLSHHEIWPAEVA